MRRTEGGQRVLWAIAGGPERNVVNRCRAGGLRRAGVVTAAALAVLSVASFAPAAQAQSSSGAPTLVVKVDQTRRVFVGDTVALDVSVRGARNLAAYELLGTFDRKAAAIETVDTSARSADARTRDLSLADLDGRVLLGGYTCATTDCRPSGDVIEGASGTVKLGRLFVKPKQAGTLRLHLGAARFLDGAGRPLTVAQRDQVVEIRVGRATRVHPAPALAWSASRRVARRSVLGDVNRDGRIDPADLPEIAGVWQTRRLANRPCRLDGRSDVDVNGDGCIDVADLQGAAAAIAAQDPPSKASGRIKGTYRLPTIMAGETYTVTNTSDATDSNIGNNICAIAGGGCSLRAAIQEANARSGFQTINFNIPGPGVQTIQLTRQLPSLSDLTGGVLIDGYSEPGSVPNTDPIASNAVINIAIVANGAGGTGAYDTLSVISANNTIKGLSIYNTRRPIWIHGIEAEYNTIVGNFVGTDPSGTYVSPNIVEVAHGINPEQDASHTTIGTPALADRNVVSGNARHGIGFWHEKSDYNIVQNNIVGLNPSGTAALPNRKHGVDMNFGVDHTIVGGTGLNERNVISGNNDTGVEISHTPGTADNEIIGNYIGTTLTGDSAPAYTRNFDTGVYIEDGSTRITVRDNVIGNNAKGGVTIISHGPTDGITTNVVVRDNLIGISNAGTPIPNGQRGVWVNGMDNVIGPGNVIAYNSGPGINASEIDSLRNKFTQNSIYANTGLGIDLSPNGITANDIDDLDAGPNDLLNYPEWTRATQKVFEGTACAGCTVEVFLADKTTGNGSGKTFITSGTAGPTGAFSIPNFLQPIGETVTAVAIQPDGATSEFSPNQPIVLHNDPPVIEAGSDVSVPENGMVSLSGSATDPDEQSVEYSWDLDGDGTFETTGQTVNFSASGLDGPSTVTVTARATDPGGLSGTDTLVVTVNNAAPTATLSAPSGGTEASSVVVQLTGATDPAAQDVAAGLRYAFACDGTPLAGTAYADAASTPSISCTLPDGPGTPTIRAAVIDKDNGLTEYAAVVSVSNVNPTVSVFGAPVSTTEGTPIPLTSSVSDPSPADVAAGFTYAWSASAESGAPQTATSADWTFTPSDNGTWTMSLVVTDKDAGAAAPVSVQTVVSNVAPTALLQTSLAEGTATLTLASPSDPSADDVAAGLRFAFSCNGASLAGVTYASASSDPTRTCLYDDGLADHLVRARVIDKDGGATEYSTTVSPTGGAPIVALDPTFHAVEGGSVQITASATDPDGGELSYAWDLDGDGSFETSGQTVTFAAGTLDGPAQYPVVVQVTDATNLASTGQTMAVIGNVAPTGTLEAVSATEGTPAAVTVSGPVDPSAADLSTLRYAVSCTGDSLAVATYATASPSASTNCTYPDGPSSATVRVRVIDKDGAFSEYTAPVTVANGAPAVDITAPATANEGTTVSFSATALDPSAVDQDAGLGTSWTVTRNGDPYASGGGLVANFFAEDDGSYVIEVTAADKDGGSTVATHTVTVNNTAPTASLTAPSSAGEGSSASVSLDGAADASAVDAAGLRYAFACDGADLSGVTYATASSTNTALCAFPDGPTSVTVRARVFDKDGGVTEYTNLVSVTNVAPTAAFSVPVDGVAGQPFALAATDLRDPSSADSLSGTTYAFDCGAGFDAYSSTTSTTCASLPAGGAIVRMKVRDKDNGENTYTARVVGHPNVFANPGFETDANSDGVPDGWTWPSSAAARVSDSVHWGSFAGRVTGTKTGVIRQGTTPVVRNRYVANAWINVPASAGTTSVRWTIRWYGSTGAPISSPASAPFTATTSGWVQLPFAVQAPNGAVSASAELSVSTNNATVWFDDLSFNLANQLLNPGMDLDANGDNRPDSWASFSRWVRSGTEIYDGAFSAVTLADGSNLGPNQKISYVVAGATYHASVWVNVPGPQVPAFRYQLRIRWLSATNVAISTTVLGGVLGTTPGWVQLQGSLVAPAGAVYGRLEIPITAATTNIYADAAFFGRA